MLKLFLSLLLIILGLVLGYVWQQWIIKGSPRHSTVIPFIRKTLQKIGLLFFMPISFIAAVWIISFEDLRVIFLPVIGAGALLLGGVLGLVAASLLKKEGGQRGVLYCCGSFTNIGAIGALVSFIFLGEAGFALVAFYKMFEEIIYYTIGFPIARYHSGTEEQVTFLHRLKGIARDPFFLAAIGSFACGLILNVSGLQRPDFFETLNAYLVPLGTFVLLVSIGLGMRFSHLGKYLTEGLIVALIKFIMVPMVAVSAAYFLGFSDIGDGLPLKVVLIVSSMPVGFTALVAASLYDLDLDLANSCWLISTGGLVIVLPWLSFLLSLM